MAGIMKIKCNGPGAHINEVDLERLKKPTRVLRGAPARTGSGETYPERSVLPCRHCKEGQVIVTRAMIAEFSRK